MPLKMCSAAVLRIHETRKDYNDMRREDHSGQLCIASIRTSAAPGENRKKLCLQRWETWIETPHIKGVALTMTQVGLYEQAALEQCLAKQQVLQLLAQYGTE